MPLIKDAIWSIVSKTGALLSGIRETPLFFEHHLKLLQLLFRRDRIQPEFFIPAVAIDELSATPGADLYWTTQFMILSGNGMTGRADIFIELQRFINRQSISRSTNRLEGLGTIIAEKIYEFIGKKTIGHPALKFNTFT